MNVPRGQSSHASIAERNPSRLAAGRTALLMALVAVAVALFVVVAAEPAVAAPGGLIKQAARTPWAKAAIAALVILFLPLIIWHMVKRAILVRRTKRMLAQLGGQVAYFDWLPLKERITQVFGWVHSAWDQGKMQIAHEYMTEWYRMNQQLQLEKWERDGLRNITSDVKIKRMTPLHVSHDPAAPQNDRVVVEIDAEMRDYLVDRESGRVVEGDKTLGDVTTIWTLVRAGERWVLSNIEPDSMVMEYLTEPKRVPVPSVKRPA
jgi:hypothetical protein